MLRQTGNILRLSRSLRPVAAKRVVVLLPRVNARTFTRYTPLLQEQDPTTIEPVETDLGYEEDDGESSPHPSTWLAAKTALTQLRDSTSPVESDTLALVVKNTYFESPLEITEFLRDWSDLLQGLKDREAWDMLFNKIAFFERNGWWAAWKGFVQCGDRGFSRNPHAARFMFKLLIQTSHGRAEWADWSVDSLEMVEQYRNHMLTSPFLTNRPQIVPPFVSRTITANSTNGEHVMSLVTDMFDSLQIPTLVEDVWFSPDAVPPVPFNRVFQSSLGTLVIKTLYEPQGLAPTVRVLNIVLQMLQHKGDSTQPEIKANLLKMILAVSRQTIFWESSHGAYRAYEAREAIRPIVQACEDFIRSEPFLPNDESLMEGLIYAYGYCQDHDMVTQLWQQMYSRISVTGRMISVLFESCATHGDLTMALITWADLRDKGRNIDTHGWKAYIQCLSRHGEWDRILNLVCVEMKGRQGNPPAQYPTADNLVTIITQCERQSTRMPDRRTPKIAPRLQAEFPNLWPEVERTLRIRVVGQTL